MLQTLKPRWDGPIVVAATGESLTKKVAKICEGYPTIALKQAWIRFPEAEVLYACDNHWWDLYQGVPGFKGEKWSSHNPTNLDNKLIVAEKYKLKLIMGMDGQGFSTDPSVIHYGRNSGFQALNLAIHWLKKPGRIIMIGFDFTRGYFFGPHPRGLRAGGQFDGFISNYDQASKRMPEGVQIVNCSEISVLPEKIFPKMPLREALGC